MRLKIGDLTVRNLMICYVLLYSIMPIVTRLTSTYLTTYFYMAVVVVLVVLILALDRPKNLNEYLAFLLPFILYEGLTYFGSHAEIHLWGYQVLLFLLPVVLGYFFTQDQTRISNVYIIFLVFAVAITMITTIVGCIQNPSAARTLASVDSHDTISYNYDMKNIGGYSFVYITVLLYPILILAYKSRRVKLLPTVILTIVLLLLIISSEYTTALLLFIVTSLLFLTKRNLSVRGIILISVFAILFLVVFNNVLFDFLKWLSESVDSESMSKRLLALAGGTTGLEQSEDNRLELYQRSINTFLSHPVWGTFMAGYSSDGGHSFILDSLAQFGVLGGALLLFMYKNVFTRFFLPFKDKPGFGYVVWTFVQAIILSLVNTGMWLIALCLYVPMLLHWIYGLETVEDEDYEKPSRDSNKYVSVK